MDTIQLTKQQLIEHLISSDDVDIEVEEYYPLDNTSSSLSSEHKVVMYRIKLGMTVNEKNTRR